MQMKARNLLPHEASIIHSSNKKFEELIVFVHFFGGRKLHMKRHVEFVNDLGYDALTFNLSFNRSFWFKRFPLSRNKKFGLKYLWADEVEDVLNAVPGPKIVYAFSNPASCAIDAIARRKARDIKALLCDSGPFAQMIRCSWNLLTHEYVVKSRLARIPAVVSLSALWGVDHTSTLHSDLQSLPKDFPVLSIRGWEDPLVPVSAIDDAFKGSDQLRYETLALPKATHLNGLKDFAEDYQPKVERFLKSSATKIAP